MDPEPESNLGLFCCRLKSGFTCEFPRVPPKLYPGYTQIYLDLTWINPGLSWFSLWVPPGVRSVSVWDLKNYTKKVVKYFFMWLEISIFVF